MKCLGPFSLMLSPKAFLWSYQAKITDTTFLLCLSGLLHSVSGYQIVYFLTRLKAIGKLIMDIPTPKTVNTFRFSLPYLLRIVQYISKGTLKIFCPIWDWLFYRFKIIYELHESEQIQSTLDEATSLIVTCDATTISHYHCLGSWLAIRRFIVLMNFTSLNSLRSYI